MSKFLLLSLEKYDIEINGSIHLGNFFVIEKLEFYKTDIINFESRIWGLEICVSADTYVHIHVDFNQKKTRYLIFSLEIPNCVNVTSEFQDSHVIRCISLNCCKSGYCFMSVTGVQTPREIWVLSLFLPNLHLCFLLKKERTWATEI